jgi:hypothetical protein
LQLSFDGSNKYTMAEDLNKASLEELQARGVPSVVARAIVVERQQVRVQPAWLVEHSIGNNYPGFHPQL